MGWERRKWGTLENSHFMLRCVSSERNVKPHIIKATSLFRNGPHESHCGVFYVLKSCKCCNPLRVTQSWMFHNRSHISACIEIRQTHRINPPGCLCLRVSCGKFVRCVLMFSIDLSEVNAVAMVTMTHPSPPTLVILSLKSTELWLGGFHFRMSSHLPGLYFYRDAKNTDTNHFMTWSKQCRGKQYSFISYKKINAIYYP